MNQSYIITLEETPAPEDIRFVQEGLRLYNLLHAPDDGYRPLAVFVRTPEQTLVGGLLGNTYWDWLHVDILWLDESVRQQGLGQQVLKMAEQEAVQRGCRYAHLDTLSFQALPFYEMQGYTIFGVLEDLPPGHRRYFLRKKLK